MTSAVHADGKETEDTRTDDSNWPYGGKTFKRALTPQGDPSAVPLALSGFKEVTVDELSLEALKDSQGIDIAAKIKSDGWATSYYELPKNAVEIQDLVEHKNMNFAVGNIFKACYRLNNKEGNDDAYDLRKIIWYAKRELNRVLKQK